MLPQFKGATTVYDFLIKPVFARLKGIITIIISIITITIIIIIITITIVIIIIITIIITIIILAVDIDSALNNVKSDKVYESTKKKE